MTFYEEKIMNPETEQEEVIITYGSEKDWAEVENDHEFQDWDVLVLIEMPFNSCGRHATGDAIFFNGKWHIEYENEPEDILEEVEV